MLPGTIEGLVEKLDLLLAEFSAGNTTTRTEILAILDELKNSDAIDEEDYMKCNNLLVGVKPEDLIENTSDFIVTFFPSINSLMASVAAHTVSMG